MKICWFGTYNSNWGRSKIYIQGLQEMGVEVLECQSLASGFQKYIELFSKHKKIVGQGYDALVVGYPSHSVVWFAKLLSRKLVIFDALCTMYEGVVISRKEYRATSLRGLYIQFIDWLAVRCADVVLVESEEQRKYFVDKFGESSKYRLVYTGADDSIFYPDPEVNKKEMFTVLFRGKFLPEAGIKYIIESAKILEEKQVNFLIVGNGWLEKELRIMSQELRLKNLELITENLSNDDLRVKMLGCHISLGQFENHERLSRTIPHKCYESLALGLPYLTAETLGVREILKDGENCLMCQPADPEDLVAKILYLKNNPDVLEKIGDNGHQLYLQKFTPKILASQILQIIRSNS